MLNKVELIGNLGAKPDIRATKSGEKVATFSIATNEKWKDKKTGEKKERTEWHRVACFNQNLCEILEKYTNKGSKIRIEGKLQTRKWTDNNNIERYTTEVVLPLFGGEILLLDAPVKNSPPPANSPDDYGTTKNLDDDIPF